MDDQVLSTQGKIGSADEDYSKDGTEGCMNCEFIECRDGIRNYCSEYERFVKDYDPPCKAYVEQGSY